MAKLHNWIRIVFGAVLVGAPLAASAQDVAAQSSQGGPMAVEEIHQHFGIAPDFRVTKFDGSTAQLFGSYGGWLLGDSLLVGAGGYWQTNADRHHGLNYGGVVVGWQTPRGRRLGFGARTLLGIAHTRVTSSISFADLADIDRFRDGQLIRTALSRLPLQATQSRDSFVVEPQVDFLLGLTRHLRLAVGGGYRALSTGDVNGARVDGATGSISLQIGSTSEATRP